MNTLHLTLLTCVITCCSATPLDSWVHYPRPENTGPLNAVTYGNGLFVAVGAEGTIITSTDGANWAAQNSGVSYALDGVKFVNQQFFAFSFMIGDDFRPALVSSDGTNWTPIASLVDITYGKGTYVAVRPSIPSYEASNRGTICTSTNLVNWQDAFVGYNQSVEFGNNTFLAIAGEFSYTSEDGESWTQGALVSQHPNARVSFANGNFFVTGFQVVSLPVPDPPYVQDFHFWTLSITTVGTEWEHSKNLGFNLGATPSRLAIGGGYYLLGSDGFLRYTADLTSDWTTANLPIVAGEPSLDEEVCFGGGVFVAVSKGNVFRSGPVTGSFPVIIHTQPLSTSAILGSDVELFVGAQGSEPMSIQWRKDGTAISGATNQVLLLSDVDFDTAGEYDVIVTNPEGSVTSQTAAVTIHFADVHSYAGVTLRGRPGDQFQLEYQNSLDSSGEWHELTEITLTEAVQIWIDYDSPNEAKRFYRATFLGN